MPNISLQEFFDKDKHPHAYVHCTSEAQAIKLTRAFHEMGRHWSGGQKYRDETYWYDYDTEKWYSNHGAYSSSDPDDDWDGNEAEVFEFDEITDFHPAATATTTNDKKQLRVLMRDTLEWRNATWDQQSQYLSVRGSSVSSTQLVAIENDPRVKYLVCSKCGMIVRNTKKFIAEHAALAQSSKACLTCPVLKTTNVQQKVESYTKNADGTYTYNQKQKCELKCGNSRAFYSIDATEARGVCRYRQCTADTLKPFDDVFIKYPDLFDEMATIDALSNEQWNLYYKNSTYTKFKHTGKYTLYAYINKLGILDRFVLEYRNGTYEFVYSAKYDKMFLIDYGCYEEITNGSHSFTSTAVNNLLKIMHSIYKGEENA